MPGLRPRPRERLDAEQRARAEVPDRLERGADVLGGEQAVQGADLLGAGDRDAVADVVEVHDRRAAVALGLVERGVGLGEQRSRSWPGRSTLRADAGRDPRPRSAAARRRATARAPVGAGAAEDQRELVAADAVGAVAGADDRAGRRRRAAAARRRAGGRGGR